MLDPLLRPVKDRLLTPLARVVTPWVHPSAITLAGFAVGVACVACLLNGRYAAGLILWLLNRSLDGLDGLVARESGRQTDLGGYLDILLDFVIYAAVPVALATRSPDGLGLPLAILLSAFYVNAASWMYLAALLEKRGSTEMVPGPTSVSMPTGLIEGAETIVLVSAMILLPDLVSDLFWLMSSLLALTIVQRFAWAAMNLPEGGGARR